MGKIKKKHQKGIVTAFLTQKQAMRRLQLSLPNFRRLCILKGIYPIEPSNRKKVGKGNSQPRVFYHTKDIAFLNHEPLIEKFRKLRVYHNKLKRARERKDKDKEFRIRMNKPRYSLHHIVKERYPSVQDAIHDLSDSLNLIFLFARLPRLTQFSPALIGLSRRLCMEFLNFIVTTRAIRKAFITIKGFYIESELNGVSVVWIIPHSSATHSPSDVDYRILATCLEFDSTLVGSVLCHLYNSKGLLYPPKLSVYLDVDPTSQYCGMNDNYFELLSCLSYPIRRIGSGDDEDVQMDDLSELQAIDDQISQAVNKQVEVQRIQNLFKGKRFFLMREVPREVLALIIRACGGECSWDQTLCPGSLYTEDDTSINYQIVDRPMSEMKVTRYYVQPQWIFDSLNAKRLLPAQDYLPGVSLPPHLSPFATGAGFGDDLDESIRGPSQRGGLTGVAPGFGEGAGLYRPPEADYLAGLVTLAEIRGGSIQARVDHSHANDNEVIGDVLVSDASECDENQNNLSVTSDRKPSKSKKLKKPSKGEQPIITPGRLENKKRKKMEEQAQQNAERKLREMLLPKKHKNAYKKMVHSIKRKEKEVRQLKEKRQLLDTKQMN